MNKKAIVFDLDGTLVNTLDDIADSVNAALVYFGYPIHNVNDIRLMIGKGAKNLITRALPPDNRSDTEIEEILKYYREYYSKNLLVKTCVYDGVFEALNILSSRGVKLAVLSNKDDGQVKEIVSKLLPNTFEIISGYSPKFPHKPAPDSVLDIIDKLGISLSETAFVGDSSVDILTAKNAGILSAGVTWGFGGEQEFNENIPDVIVRSPIQLCKL